MQEEIERLNQVLRGKMDEIYDKDQQILRFQQNLDKVQGTDMVEYKRQINTFETKIVTYEQRISTYEQRISSYDQLTDELRQKLSGLGQENDEMRRRTVEYEGKLSLMGPEIDRLNNTLRIKVEELRISEERFRSIQIELEDLRGKYNDMEFRIKQQMNSDMSKLQHENDDLKRKLQNSNQEIEDLKRRFNSVTQ